MAKFICDICGVNDATIKNYITFDEGTDYENLVKIPSCEPCVGLSGRSVSKLMSSPKKERLRLIKKWWTPEKRRTTLPAKYPGVDWDKVRISIHGFSCPPAGSVL